MRHQFAILVLVLIALGTYVNAASAAILPKCDQTVYYISTDENNPYACDIRTNQNCRKLPPDQYEKEFPSRADKDAHPPIVATETACGFSDFIQLFVNLANYGLAILGVLALVFTVWGGFLFITAGGNPERVRQGKTTIWGGVLGTVIVLTSWVLVGFIVGALTGTGPKLFVGTQYERHYAGNKCPSYKRCDVNDLRLTCRDDPQGNQNAVTKAQELLSRYGCYDDDIDGCFGPRTKAAVERFQETNKNTVYIVGGETFIGLEVDGVIGRKTWAVLNAVATGGALPCAIPTAAEVLISDSGLSPQSVSVHTGGSVKWRNQTSVTVQIDETELLDTRGAARVVDIPPSGTYEFSRFGSAREISYRILRRVPLTPLTGTIVVVQ